MRKKSVNATKSSSKSATAGRYNQARGLVRMAREGSIIFAPADFGSEPNFEPLSAGSLVHKGVLAPSAQILKIGVTRRVNQDTLFEIKPANRVPKKFVMEQSKAEKKKMKEVTAAIQELYLEEQNEIDAFVNYIPAYLREQKK